MIEMGFHFRFLFYGDVLRKVLLFSFKLANTRKGGEAKGRISVEILSSLCRNKYQSLPTIT
jgi:hypothetical protein